MGKIDDIIDNSIIDRNPHSFEESINNVAGYGVVRSYTSMPILANADGFVDRMINSYRSTRSFGQFQIHLNRFINENVGDVQDLFDLSYPHQSVFSYDPDMNMTGATLDDGYFYPANVDTNVLFKFKDGVPDLNIKSIEVINITHLEGYSSNFNVSIFVDGETGAYYEHFVLPIVDIIANGGEVPHEWIINLQTELGDKLNGIPITELTIWGAVESYQVAIRYEEGFQSSKPFASGALYHNVTAFNNLATKDNFSLQTSCDSASTTEKISLVTSIVRKQNAGGIIRYSKQLNGLEISIDCEDDTTDHLKIVIHQRDDRGEWLANEFDFIHNRVAKVWLFPSKASGSRMLHIPIEISMVSDKVPEGLEDQLIISFEDYLRKTIVIRGLDADYYDDFSADNDYSMLHF